MISHSLEETLKTLTYYQASILYWTCEGWSNENIAARYKYTKAWVVWQMSFVYHKLGIDRIDQKTRKKPHWTERRAFLQEKVCPVLRRLINDDPERLEIFPIIPPNVYEGDLVYIPPGTPQSEIPPLETTIPQLEPQSEPPELPSPGENPPPEPPPDFYPIELYNAWLAVLEDEKRGPDPTPLPSPVPIRQPERRGILWGRLITLGLGVLLGCVAVGALAYWLGSTGAFVRATETPITTIQLTSTSEPTPTILSTDTQTALPADTLAPTLTLTPPATITSLPANTQSTSGLGIGQEISDARVTLKLIDVRFNEGYDRVGSRVAPVNHIFEYTNHSGDTLLVQFNTSHFVIEDNTGRTAECWFFRAPYAFEEWNLPLNDNSKEIITTRCGDGRVPQDVTSYTLTIHPFTSLPESTWVVEVPR